MPTRNADDWVIATGMAGGKRTIIRALSEIPAALDRGDRTILILITWTYDDTATGMPDVTTLDTIEDFEAAIFASIDQDDWATEAAAITGNGAKQWRFYCADENDFVTRFSAALDGHPVYPIELEAIADPEWQALRELHPA